MYSPREVVRDGHDRMGDMSSSGRCQSPGTIVTAASLAARDAYHEMERLDTRCIYRGSAYAIR